MRVKDRSNKNFTIQFTIDLKSLKLWRRSHRETVLAWESKFWSKICSTTKTPDGRRQKKNQKFRRKMKSPNKLSRKIKSNATKHLEILPLRKSSRWSISNVKTIMIHAHLKVRNHLLIRPPHIKSNQRSQMHLTPPENLTSLRSTNSWNKSSQQISVWLHQTSSRVTINPSKMRKVA